MYNRLQILLTGLVIAMLSSTVNATDLPRLRVHEDGRHFETSDGQPFFWLGDTAWRLWRLTEPELETYLGTRAEQGFNVIQGPTLHNDRTNARGDTFGSLTEINGDWFAYIDHIIDRAAGHNLYVAPVLTWGSRAERFTEDTARRFGQFVGRRYADRTNIAAFIIAGEFNQPRPHVAIWHAMAEGLQNGLGNSETMITIHPKFFHGLKGQSSSHHFHDADWLDFNMIQSSQRGDCSNTEGHDSYIGVHNWLLVANDYAKSPVKPTFDAEATYEQMDTYHPKCDQPGASRYWDAFGVRRRAYWSVFAGGAGHTYGANGIWQFHKAGDDKRKTGARHTWREALSFPGAAHMRYLRSLMESRPGPRQPCQDWLDPTPPDDVPSHIRATAATDGRWAMVYVPDAGRNVGLRVNTMTGTELAAWWYKPTNGEAAFIGLFDRQASDVLRFITPRAGEDWVLVVDDAAAGFPPPGKSPEMQ